MALFQTFSLCKWAISHPFHLIWKNMMLKEKEKNMYQETTQQLQVYRHDIHKFSIILEYYALLGSRTCFSLEMRKSSGALFEV